MHFHLFSLPITKELSMRQQFAKNNLTVDSKALKRCIHTLTNQIHFHEFILRNYLSYKQENMNNEGLCLKVKIVEIDFYNSISWGQ